MSRTKLHTHSIKKRLRLVYGDYCPACTKKMSFERQEDTLFATLDHVIPLSAGGTNDEDNFQLLCNLCNQKKGAKLEPRLDGGPYPLPNPSPSPTSSDGMEVNRRTISKFWDLRCGLCGRLEPCPQHERDSTKHSG